MRLARSSEHGVGAATGVGSGANPASPSLARMARGRQGQGDPVDWVTRAADDAVRHAGEGNLVTVASGASPSGPIHLGNLREFITPHFVAEELRRRGVPVRHLHSWDDFDRFRKVPAGVPAEWADHIGRPLTAVPDPWECHASWAEHFKAPLQDALRELGVEMEEISQTQMYTSGAYREQVLESVSRRDEIEAVLAKHRTKKVAPAEDASEQEAADLADSVANEDDEEGDPSATSSADAIARFPYRPYCRQCGRDTVTTTAYDDATTTLSYTCSSCGFEGTTNLSTDTDGKLVWKVDWPMRWAYEKVNFEPAGRDHMTPGSSYTVGTEIVSSIFDWRAPARVIYAFVGFAGVQKMSSSAGGVPTADRRAAHPRGADAALALRPPRSHAGLRHRLRRLRRAAVRRVGRARSQGRRPGQVRRRDAGLAPRLRDGVHRPAPLPRRAGPVPDAVVGRRRDSGIGRPHLADHRVVGLPARLGRRPRAPAVQGDAVDGRARARRRAHHRARDAGHRAPRPRSARTRSCGCGSSSTGSPTTATSTPSRRSSTGCPRSRAASASTTPPPTR